MYIFNKHKYFVYYIITTIPNINNNCKITIIKYIYIYIYIFNYYKLITFIWLIHIDRYLLFYKFIHKHTSSVVRLLMHMAPVCFVYDYRG